MAVDHPETLGEEIANAVTHGIGAMLSVAALALMVSFASFQHSDYKVVGTAVFGSTLVLMYLASMFYHALTNPTAKHIFKIFDHATIYLLIAGTYTPFTLVNLRGDWGWTLFGIMWGLALIGIIAKCWLVNKGEVLSTIIYLLMGWMIVLAIVPVIHNLSVGGIVWLAIGGGCYTLGTAFFFLENMPFNHMIWHLFVLAGSISHFFAVFFYVIPAHR